jgi:hypothetical protein
MLIQKRYVDYKFSKFLIVGKLLLQFVHVKTFSQSFDSSLPRVHDMTKHTLILPVNVLPRNFPPLEFLFEIVIKESAGTLQIANINHPAAATAHDIMPPIIAGITVMPQFTKYGISLIRWHKSVNLCQ